MTFCANTAVLAAAIAQAASNLSANRFFIFISSKGLNQQSQCHTALLREYFSRLALSRFPAILNLRD
jgi:hypothetical protein